MPKAEEDRVSGKERRLWLLFGALVAAAWVLVAAAVWPLLRGR